VAFPAAPLLRPIDPPAAGSYVLAVPLSCQECLLLADAEARGWRLVRVDVPGEDDEPMLASYCPACAGREFGALPHGGGMVGPLMAAPVGHGSTPKTAAARTTHVARFTS